MNEFLLNSFNTTAEMKLNEESSTINNDEDIIRPNFHTKSKSRNLSFNSVTNFMSNFPLDISNNNKIEKDNKYICDNQIDISSGFLNKISVELEGNVNSKSDAEDSKKELKNNLKKKRKRKENIKDNIDMTLFKKKNVKKNNSFGDNVSKNYKTLKLKKKNKDISGPRYMKFRNHTNVSYSYSSAIISNHYILNNENPYIQDLSYIMNPTNIYDFDINNKYNTDSKDSNINLNAEFIENEKKNKLDCNDYIFQLNLSLIDKKIVNEPITINLKKALSSMCDFTEFKKGQLEAIKNVLNFKSSLVVLQTGGGKSLCYQLPSYIYKTLNVPNLTLVISPTISLMQDQLFCLPKALKGALFVNSLTELEQKHTIQQLIDREIDILFITPERLHSKNFQELLRSFPPINFSCIDEVHCLSEWSHNFRPSYLYLNQILRKSLNIKCIIGLTGSLTLETQSNIIKMLNIHEENVISGNLIRNNIRLTISEDSNKENTIILLLRTPCFHKLNSIIVYCMRQNQCDSLASHLRAYGFQAESYHAGKSKIDREIIQSRFMNNNLRIIVATIAFGLGINKPDVRGVIHFNMPKSIEDYTQEIGRSGRDSNIAYCHLFLSSNDYIKMRSLAYCDGVDSSSINTMLNKIILEDYNITVHDTKRIFLSVDTSEIDFDMKKETISTILNYLDLEDKSINTYLPINSKIIIKTYKLNINEIEEKEGYNEVLNYIINKSEKSRSSYVISVEKICNTLDCSPFYIFNELNRLKKTYKFDINYSNTSFYLEIDKIILKKNLKSLNINENEWINILSNKLLKHLNKIEKSKVKKVDELYRLLKKSATKSISENCIYWENIINQSKDEYKISNENDREKIKLNIELENKLRNNIKDYYSNKYFDENEENDKWGFCDEELINNSKKCHLAMDIDVKTFIFDNISEIKTGRSVARIFHGIPSPQYPASKWYKNKLWGKYININFEEIERIAKITLQSFKNKKIV
ncbi:ATP-dependent DNA helicase [Piromyces finnis]|uniref:DNA 3'-5' helicase n=1 Tax=Piromyces finnis TaxID=1754191 RepID=A0A1Y1VJ84_9FUNG|nr:ATP-dependent DNA helicase [Piromyces finnis]|eukprot:ORX57724.1 ATP-dependent DNA helicase [Piromyces finnis]